MRFSSVLQALAVSAILCAGSQPAQAVISYGTLCNFDVINDTGQECHGFEIELEGVSAADVVYTFGAPYQRYGDPTVVPTATGVIVRYAAGYDGAGKVWSATTPFTGPPYLPTQGHSCWTGGVANPSDYFNCGCDHFGISLNANPTNTTYRWLVETSPGSGTLSPVGTNLPLPAPVWNVTPQPPPAPGLPPAPPVVVAAIAPPAPEAFEFGDAIWVKVYTTELSIDLLPEDLNHLVIDDPEIDMVPNEPAEVEIEWVLLQSAVGKPGDQEFGGQVGAGAEAVSRRFEFYKYTGTYDGETHEALCDNPTLCPEAVGDVIGAQNVAVNLLGDLIPLNQAPIAHAGTDTNAYAWDTVTLDGSGSIDPEGSPLQYAWSFVQVPAGSKSVIKNPTSVSPTFVPDRAGTYVVGLLVNDGIDSSNLATVTITATIPAIRSVTLSPAAVVGSLQSSTGTVVLGAPAPLGGITVALSSDTPSAAAPAVASVTIPYKASKATFTIGTSNVTTRTIAGISAEVSGQIKTANLTVNPVLSAFSVKPANPAGGYANCVGTVTLGTTTSSNLQVTIYSLRPFVASAPSQVTVAAGTRAVSFPISTVSVAANTTASFTASYGGVSKTAKLTVVPLLAAFTLESTSTLGGTSTVANVRLAAPAPAGGIPVALTTSLPTIATPVSPTLVVAEGNTTASVVMQTSRVTVKKAVSLGATFGGKTARATLTVLP